MIQRWSMGRRIVKEIAVQFFVIEKFRNQNGKAVYRRLRDRGRQTPEGLTFVSSWVSADLDRCFQVMECDDVTLLQRWAAEWSDLVEFEIVPVVPGRETAEALADQLEEATT
jgi:hypothetical protein